jgi:hypothetical protein
MLRVAWNSKKQVSSSYSWLPSTLTVRSFSENFTELLTAFKMDAITRGVICLHTFGQKRWGLTASDNKRVSWVAVSRWVTVGNSTAVNGRQAGTEKAVKLFGEGAICVDKCRKIVRKFWNRPCYTVWAGRFQGGNSDTMLRGGLPTLSASAQCKYQTTSLTDHPCVTHHPATTPHTNQPK